MLHDVKGKELKDWAFSELIDFYHQRIFFKFMDSGRSGLEYASQEYLNALIEWQGNRITATKDVIKDRLYTSGEYGKLLEACQYEIVNAFINSGMSKINGCLTTVNIQLSQILSPVTNSNKR